MNLMNKVSSTVQDQAAHQFAQKRKQVIQNSLSKHKDKENFQNILNTFLTSK